MRNIILLTVLFSLNVMARPQGIAIQYYTIINGKQSFLPVALQPAAATPVELNQGGPAIVTVPGPQVTVFTTAYSTTMVVAAATVGPTKQGVAPVPLVPVDTVGAPAAPTPAVIGGVFLQGNNVGTPAAVTTRVVVQQTTVIPPAVPVNTIVVPVPAAPSISVYTPPVYTGPVNNVCSGDANAITAYEQANNGGKPLNFVVTNSCPYSIWPEINYREWPNSGEVSIVNIGELKPNSAPFTWSDHPFWMTSARMWAKEGCDSNGLNCKVDAPNFPTLFEYTIYPDSYDSCKPEINYDISLVDGHTIPISVTFDSPTCQSRTCLASKNLNGACPGANDNTVGGQLIGCLSACSELQSQGIFGGEAFELACCSGSHNTAATCPPTSTWFANACPEAYSYAYDDVAANRDCAVPTTVNIAYCPNGAMP